MVVLKLPMNMKEIIQGDGDMQIYEVGFHIIPIVSVDALPAEVNAIRSLVESNGGAIISEQAPESRELAYTLTRMTAGKREKFNSAYFGWIKFECPVGAVNTVKDTLDKNRNILRHLIIKTVRENTMVVPKEIKEIGAEETGKVEKVVSPEEIDKTIDELVSAK